MTFPIAIALFATVNIAIGYALAMYLGRSQSFVRTNRAPSRSSRSSPSVATPDLAAQPKTEQAEAVEKSKLGKEASKQPEPEPKKAVKADAKEEVEVAQSTEADGKEQEAASAIGGEPVAEATDANKAKPQAAEPGPEAVAAAAPPSEESAPKAEEPTSGTPQESSEGEEVLADLESLSSDVDSVKQGNTQTEEAVENQPAEAAAV